jgi:hypothetical protein
LSSEAPRRARGLARRALGLDPDLLALAGLGALVALRFAPDWLRGVTPFWGDLSYLHHPWRAYDAELLAAGRLPLWNPFLYFGMPQAAAMQDSLYSPGTTPFFVFGFATALALFEAAQYWLAAALAYLWLRSWRLGRAAAFGGAALYALSGLMLSREPFLNHLAALALAPALALFFTRAGALSLTLCLSFFAGYPPFVVGAALSAWAVSLAAAGRRAARAAASGARAWLRAGLGAAALSGCLLLPAVELVRLSRRSSGVGLEEALTYGFSWRDLAQWVSPLLVHGFNPAVEWWKCCYLGVAGTLAVLAGLRALPARRAAPLLAAVAAVVLLTLGSSTAVSAWLWAFFPPLRFIRYPGNTAYLAALPLCALAAAGLQSAPRRWRAAAAAALCAELSLCAWGVMPRAPRGLFTAKGPLAEKLQGELAGARYFMSWGALNRSSGAGALEWRQRLYGLTNAPLKLRAGSNFGEPLVPQANYALLDRLFRAPGPAALAPELPWLDASVLLTATPASGPGLEPAAAPLWSMARAAGAAPARYLSPREGELLPADGPAPALTGLPLPLQRPREDAFGVEGQGAGWAFVSEPLFPGWSAWLETPLGPGRARPLPALGPFQKVAVPDGPWTVRWRYSPPSFGWGLALTLGAAGALAAYWYNRAREAA